MMQRFVRSAIMGIGVVVIAAIGLMVWQSALPTPCKQVELPPSKGMLGYYPPPSPPSLLDKVMARITPCTPQPAADQYRKPTGGNGSPGFPPPE